MSSDTPNQEHGTALQPAEVRERMDWMAADLAGEKRDLSWYIENAEAGDRDAALRALQLCAQSLTPAAIAQNRIHMPPMLIDALRRIIEPAARTGDSAVMRAARGSPLTRTADVSGRNITWWRCYEMHQLLVADPSLSRIRAAEQVLGDQAGQPETLRKRYGEYRPQLEAYFHDLKAGAEK